MKVLAIQTVEFPNSIAIFDASQETVEQIILEKRNQTIELLGDSLTKLLQKTDVPQDQVNLFSVCIGPGSYTGTRGGVAFAKGFCQFSGATFIGVTAFDVLEHIAKTVYPQSRTVCALMDAKNQRVYYKKDTGEESVDHVTDVVKSIKAKTLFIGSGAFEYREIIEDIVEDNALFAEKKDCYTNAVTVAAVGQKLFEQGKGKDFSTMPLYILPPNITKPKKK